MSFLDALRGGLPDGAVLTDPDLLRGYRQDWARDPDAGDARIQHRAELRHQQSSRRFDLHALAAATEIPAFDRASGEGVAHLNAGVIPQIGRLLRRAARLQIAR